jgi:hypothetical protein
VGVLHLSRLASISIATIIIYLFLIVNLAVAEDTIDNMVAAEFYITFQTGTDLNVEVIMDAIQLTTDQTYDEEGIKSASDQELGAFRLLLFQMLERQLEGIFENAEIVNFSMPIFNGERFIEELNVELTPTYFELNESVNTRDFINGVLDMGAVVNYSLDLQAEPGWNNTYLIGLGANLVFKRTTGTLDGDDVRWTVKNWNGYNPSKLALIQLIMGAPTSSAMTSNDIVLEFVLDAEGTEQVSLSNNILVKVEDISSYSVLPDFINNLEFIPADGFRLFVDNDFLTWDDCYDITISPLREIIISTVEQSSLNQSLDIEFDWDETTTSNILIPYEITNMDDDPPLRALLIDNNINLQICDISGRALFGLINSGANANISEEDVNFGDGLNNIGYEYNITLYLPDNLYLDGENIYTWNESNPVSGEFESDVAKSYDDEEKDTVVEIEIKSTELNLLSFFTGKTELTFGVDSKSTSNYNVTKLPQEFYIPEKVALPYLNSDAFRLCVEENVFNSESVDAFLKSERDLFVNVLKQALPGLDISGNINRKVFDGSLILWDGNISNMDAYTPVKTESYAHSSYSISFNLDFLPPSVNVPILKFNFSGLSNQNATYKMIFPHGIYIDANDQLNKTTVEKMKDGRYYILISFSASEENLTLEISCKITPSAIFVIGIFVPCIISLVIAIILVIIVYIIRKKRRSKKADIPIEPEEDINGYKEEDYYVPPPPNLKK